MSPVIRTLCTRSLSRFTLRSSVDLPQPLGPTSAVTLLMGIGIVIEWIACLAPYQRLNRSISSTGLSAST